MSASTSANWFRDVIEPLADSFTAEGVERYVDIFTSAIGRPELRLRYAEVRRERRFSGPEPVEIFVLSRVTLGADVAITSVVLDAMLKRFPRARVFFAGPRKNFELFERRPHLEHLEMPYARGGTLEDRLAASDGLRPLLDKPEAIVVDPDSRLTQLGLIPVCDPSRYYFFESRSAEGNGSLSELTARWMHRAFDVGGARAFVHCAPAPLTADITVSLGVGENPAKRIGGTFERDLMQLLSATGRSIVVDQGAGGEETDRVLAAIHGLPGVRTWQGAFAPFAAIVAGSRFYVGYDSAAQHVAAACGVALLTIFAGAPNPRFLERWRPSGNGRISVIGADRADPDAVLREVAGYLAQSSV